MIIPLNENDEVQMQPVELDGNAVRAPMEIILERPAVFTLAGREYRVKPAKLDADLRWREACGRFTADFGLAAKMPPDLPRDQVEAEATRRGFAFLYGRGLDAGMELVYAYAPELAADRGRIEAEASFVEKIDAALEVFKVALPFIMAGLRLSEMMQRMQA